MIPILFKRNETAFTTNGIGRLSDAITCKVEEERNGVYELVMTYPITGLHYSDIAHELLIYARHSDALDMQAFRIYRISRPINGVVTINARHISYDLSNVVISAMEATSVADAFSKFRMAAINNIAFDFWTNKTTAGNFAVEVPSSLRSVLGGTSGSILDVFGGGDYEFDMFTVKLYNNRGNDNGVTIRYGKNLTDLTRLTESGETFSGVAPFWKADDLVVTLPEGAIYAPGAATYTDKYTDKNNVIYTNSRGVEYEGVVLDPRIIPLDLSDKFEKEPTVEQLRAAATAWLTANGNFVPKESINISFVQLWQTEEYKNLAPLQRVRLCDNVNIIYTKLGVSGVSRVIRTVYDVLLERYDEVDLGAPRTTLAGSMAARTEEIREVEKNSLRLSDVERAVEEQTRIITGGMGGYVVIAQSTNGYPEEILIMDTPDKETATNVIRMNKNGIGFSRTGYNGPFTTAWTINGAFNADYITAGTMSANRIKGGVMTLGGKETTYGNGALYVRNSNDALVARLDVDGLYAIRGKIANFTIGDNSISNGMTGLNDTTNSGIWLGTNGIALGAGKFKVTSGGDVDITGKITATTGAVGGITLDVTYGLYTNGKTSATSTKEGFLISKNGSIYLGPYESAYSSCRFQVTSAGYLTARNATINGTITATTLTATNSGTIGGCKIDGSTLKMEDTANSRSLVIGGAKVYGVDNVGSKIGTVGMYKDSSNGHALGVSVGYSYNYVGFAADTSNTVNSQANLVLGYYRNVSDRSNDYTFSFKPMYITAKYASGMVMCTRSSSYEISAQYYDSNIYFYYNNTQVGYLTKSSSDKRLKDGITDITAEYLERIVSVPLKQFFFKSDENKAIHFGAIAQDVQEALGESDDTAIVIQLPPAEEGGDSYLALDYTEFLIARMAALEMKIKELEKKMEEN